MTRKRGRGRIALAATMWVGASACVSPAVGVQIRGKGTSPPQHSSTAEELLETLRKRRPLNEVIPPESASRMEALPSKLLPEGTIIVERTGTITLQDPWWVFSPVADGEPTRVLPNLMLETMVRMVRASKTPLLFVISGEMTVFEDANYLLIRSTSRSTEEAATSPRSDRDAEVLDEKPAKVADDDSATDVLSVLKNQRRRRPAVPDSGEGDHRSVEEHPDVVPGMLDGFALVDRPGRILRRGIWWSLVLESNHSQQAERPLRLLPCSATELMVHTSSLHTGGVVFTVSGEVTSFFGKNYLLPRVVTRRFASGNLRK